MRHPLYEAPCAYCADRATTEDHIVPRCQGGQLTAPACSRCNSLKGGRTPTQWLITLLTRVAKGDRRAICQVHRMMPQMAGLCRSGIVVDRDLCVWFKAFQAERERSSDDVMVTLCALLGFDGALGDFEFLVAESEPF